MISKWLTQRNALAHTTAKATATFSFWVQLVASENFVLLHLRFKIKQNNKQNLLTHKVPLFLTFVHAQRPSSSSFMAYGMTKVNKSTYTCAQLLSHIWLFATLWTATQHAHLSMGFLKQEYWSGLPFPSTGESSDPGIEPSSPALEGRFFTTEPERKP